MEKILTRLGNIGIVPVVKISREEDAIPVAQALLNGGIDCMEITFRSDHTLHAIKVITESLPEVLVGAGTVSTVEQAKLAVEAGAVFIVTPGFNTKVVEWCLEHKVLVIPGIATPSEIETALSYGLTNLKLFPAETMGGAKFIKDISGPYPEVRIMPTGGINLNNMHDYLKLKNVIAIGGSFMLPDGLIRDGKWSELEALSKDSIKALLDIKLESMTCASISDDFLSLVGNTELSNADSNTLVFSSPYLDRARYHMGKAKVSESGFTLKERV